MLPRDIEAGEEKQRRYLSRVRLWEDADGCPA